MDCFWEWMDSFNGITLSTFGRAEGEEGREGQEEKCQKEINAVCFLHLFVFVERESVLGLQR
jgi:hypothetical protein